FRQPHQRLNRLKLAKEESSALSHLRVIPVLQQPLGNASRSRIIRLAPGLYPWPNLVHQRQLNKLARIIERFGSFRSPHISRRPSSWLASKTPRLAVV